MRLSRPRLTSQHRHRRGRRGHLQHRPPVTDNDEIIVTAQKREENLQDVPISVQAIGTRKPRPAQHLELRGIHQAASVGQLPDRRRRASPSSTCAASRPAATATTPVRCRRSVPISTSSRSRRSAERSTSTSTTSRASRASAARRARSTAPRAKRARSASSPTSRSSESPPAASMRRSIPSRTAAWAASSKA